MAASVTIRAILFDVAGMPVDADGVLQAPPGAPAHDGVPEMLRALRSAGLALATATRSGGLVAALAELGIASRQAVCVCDSVEGLEAARRAGAGVGVALWTRTGPEERERFLHGLPAIEPDRVFERPADVTRAFAMWC